MKWIGWDCLLIHRADTLPVYYRPLTGPFPPHYRSITSLPPYGSLPSLLNSIYGGHRVISPSILPYCIVLLIAAIIHSLPPSLPFCARYLPEYDVCASTLSTHQFLRPILFKCFFIFCVLLKPFVHTYLLAILDFQCLQSVLVRFICVSTCRTPYTVPHTHSLSFPLTPRPDLTWFLQCIVVQ